jgi:transcription initiation factor TFIIIB Brf1 subunit/transcription initiation factor TFIIB
MVWCPTCGEDVEVEYSDAAAMTACVNCGRVLEDDAFASDVTFMKGADGEGEMVGQFVGDDGNVRGLQRMAGGKVWSSRVSVRSLGEACVSAFICV